MNIIEHGTKNFGSTSDKSLVEKAVERLVEARRSTMATPDVQPPGAVDTPPDQASRRQTRGFLEIDLERLRSNGFAPPGDPSQLAEELRLIKRPLLSAARRGAPDNPNLIMITSAHAGEGKTFIATNLALSIASEHDLRVLLIDGDVANPTIPRVFGFTADLGLMDVVSDASVDLFEATFRTSIPNLSILPSGRPRPGSSELFASARMARFVDEIAKREPNRIVIFDAPPVLARSEPLVLAQYISQVVFVVAADHTPSAVVRDAMNLIGPKKLGGIVLNKAMPMARKYGQYDHGNGTR